MRPHRRVVGLKLRDGRNLLAGATIITTGTFLNGLIHCGEEQYPAGRSRVSPQAFCWVKRYGAWGYELAG